MRVARDPELSARTRAQLRTAVARQQAAHDPDLPQISALAYRQAIRTAALNRLLAEAALRFAAYGLEGAPPVAGRALYVFGGGDERALHIGAYDTHAHRDGRLRVRGTLRETPMSGGVVRALELDVCELAWDPVDGLCAADTEREAAGEGALEALVQGIVRALRLSG